MTFERYSNKALLDLTKDPLTRPQAEYELSLRRGQGNYESRQEQRTKDIKKIAFYFGLPEADIWKVLETRDDDQL